MHLPFHCSGADSYIQVFGKFDFADRTKRLTAGDWNVRMYELQNDTSVYSAGGDLFKDEVLEMGDGSFVLKVPVTLPSATSSGRFTVSLITRDQDHLDDMCIEIGLNYTASEEEEAAAAQCTASGQECLICTDCPACCSGSCSLNGVCL